MDLEQKKRLRPLARARAEEFSALLGDSPADLKRRQRAIDFSDETEAYVQTLPEVDREAFGLLYEEELQALTQAENYKVLEIEATAAAKSAESAANVGSVAVFIIAVIVVVGVVFALM